MDNKITLKRLKTFLVYDSVKLIAIVLGVIMLLVIVFNAISKKPTNGQDYFMMVDNEVVIGEDGRKLLNEVKTSSYDNYGFSYDILRINNMPIDPSGYSSGYLMNTYAELGEDDIFIVADSEGDGLYENYLNSYLGDTILGYISQAEKYLTSNNFLLNGVFSEENIRLNFINTRGKDSRFETEELFVAGLSNEVNRIKAIYKNAVVLKKVLENHPELLYKTEVIKHGDRVIAEGSFAIDLSKLNGKNNKHISSVFTRAIVVDKELGTIDYTTQGVLLMIGRNYDSNGDLNYESLAVINKLIDTYSTFIDEIPADEIPEI